MTESMRTRYELRGRAAWITLDSPQNRNALSAQLIGELTAHVRAALEDAEVRVLVVTGSGPAFCAGADLKAGANAAGTRSGTDNPFLTLLRLLWEGAKPVVAAVNGHAFGGGLGLVAAADIAIAVEGARFSFSEVRVGVIPAMISVVVLPKLGVHHAMRLFLTGERFGAEEAVRYQLIHRAVPADALESSVQQEIDALALGGPRALAEAKRLLRRIPRLSVDDGFRYAEEKIAELFASEEAAEGMAAFAGRRPPSWAG